MLLVSLWVAKYEGTIKVIIHSDSQLTAHQLEGMYEVKYNQLCKYIEAYEKIKAEFQEVVLQKIPHKENRKADELA